MELSPNFELIEFYCHNGEPVPAIYHPHLLKLAREVLEPIRAEIKRPIAIISGYRTPEYNKRIRGAANSTHMTAEGADIRAGDAIALHRTIKRMHAEGRLPALGGLGSYLQWVHVDVRKAADGHLRQWSGFGVGGEK